MFKRMTIFFVIILLLFLFPLYLVAESVSAYTYTDSDTGISFIIPQGWNQTSLNSEREYIKVKYLPENKDGASIQFGYADMWAEMSDSEKIGYSRSDITHSAIMENFTKEEILQIMGYEKFGGEIETVRYNGVEYLKIVIDTEISIFDVSAGITMITFLHFDNGYAYLFFYGDYEEKSHYNDFEKVMNSVKYKIIKDKEYRVIDIDSNGDLQVDFPNLIISLILTIAVYSLPIIIYRYRIIKHSVSKKKANKITIIYGIISYFIMSIILGRAAGGSIILWGCVNHTILIKPNKNDVIINEEMPYGINREIVLGENNKENIRNLKKQIEDDEIFNVGFEVIQIEESATENESIIQSEKVEEATLKKEQSVTIDKVDDAKEYSKVLFCRKCGTRLLEDSDFCHKCGIRVIKEKVQ